MVGSKRIFENDTIFSIHRRTSENVHVKFSIQFPLLSQKKKKKNEKYFHKFQTFFDTEKCLVDRRNMYRFNLEKLL